VNDETFDVILDTDAMLQAEPAVKIAIALAWREQFNPANRQSLRDTWARAFGRHVLPYVYTADRNAFPPH
jgi:hypothetical protein